MLNMNGMELHHQIVAIITKGIWVITAWTAGGVLKKYYI